MSKLIFIFAIIFLGILAGQFVKRFQSKLSQEVPLHSIMNSIRTIAFLVFNPIVLVSSFWIVDFTNVTLITLPLLCTGMMLFLGFLATIISKLLNHTKEQRAAMFSVGTSSNVGIIGSLIVFTFFGERAYSIALMYYMFEPFYIFIVSYSIIKTILHGTFDIKSALKSIITDKTIIIYLSAIILGLLLNISPIERPSFLGIYNEYMIPLVSFMLIFSASYKMRLEKIQHNMKEGFLHVGLKYIISPIVAITIAYLLGYQNFENALLIKIVLILNLVPSSFNALMLPDLFKTDRDITNTVWVMTTAFLAIIIPLEYIFLIVL